MTTSSRGETMTKPVGNPRRARPIRRSRSKGPCSPVNLVVSVFVLLVLAYGFLRRPLPTSKEQHNLQDQNLIQTPSLTDKVDSKHHLRKPSIDENALNKKQSLPSTCEFRHYPDRRYYGLQKPDQPDFLKNSEYIYGEYPVMIVPNVMEKLCVNQSEWVTDTSTLPFADGTNPSILHIDRLRNVESYEILKSMGASYLATICMTNSQCQWNDTPQEIQEYRLSTQEKPSTVLTVLLVLNDNFHVITEATILMQRDAIWGNKKLKTEVLDDGTFGTTIRPLDDARLFVHRDKLWVSYRDGPSFGYDKQVLNPIHITSSSSKKLESVTLKASETVTFCCGRNMALITTSLHQLKSLTWVDPVTVIDVDDGHHRRLASSNQKKSHIHGTNAFMVPFGEDELLGMAHFHRPPDRKANEYARFGHHYTHAFFTITAQPPHRLKRLSSEFVLSSRYHSDDAEIIQFISGLELRDDNEVILAWGINDCEGAAGTVSKSTVDKLLRQVSPGMEVVDFMRLHGAPSQ